MTDLKKLEELAKAALSHSLCTAEVVEDCPLMNLKNYVTPSLILSLLAITEKGKQLLAADAEKE